MVNLNSSKLDEISREIGPGLNYIVPETIQQEAPHSFNNSKSDAKESQNKFLIKNNIIPICDFLHFNAFNLFDFKNKETTIPNLLLGLHKITLEMGNGMININVLIKACCTGHILFQVPNHLLNSLRKRTPSPPPLPVTGSWNRK